jgi:hypothetical protein
MAKFFIDDSPWTRMISERAASEKSEVCLDLSDSRRGFSPAADDRAWKPQPFETVSGESSTREVTGLKPLCESEVATLVSTQVYDDRVRYRSRF